MSGEELREAIVYPALTAGLEVEPGLAELLLADLRADRGGRVVRTAGEAADYDAGRLPLLAHALRTTWQQHHGSTLTVDGYQATGGIDHAIAETADHVYARLDQAGQREARMMFLRLVKIGPSAAGDARRPVARSDLATDATAEAVLDAYICSRLLTSTQDAVQITHEALLSAWPKLKGWLEEDRAGNLTRQQIEDAAAAWDRGRRDTSVLYRGASLEAAVAWESAHLRDLTQTGRDFLAASRRSARRTTIVRRCAIAILAALTLFAATAAGVASWQRSVASQQRDRAVFDEIVAEAAQLQGTNQSLADQVNLVAHRVNPTSTLTDQLISTSVTALADPLSGPGGPVHSVALSPDGRTLAAASFDDKVWLWNTIHPAHPALLGQPLIVSGGRVETVAFSPNGRTLAAGDDYGTIWLWNVTNPAHPESMGLPLAGPDGDVTSVAFSPNGRTLAAGSADDKVWLWNVTNPAHPRRLGPPLAGPGGDVFSVAFSPNGRTLAAGSFDDKVWLWNVSNPAHPEQFGQPLTGASGGVISVAFSPDGRTLAAGGLDDKVWLWNLPPAVLKGPAAYVNSVAYSPDGRTLAAGSADDKVWLWNVTNPAHPALLGSLFTSPGGPSLTGTSAGVVSVAYSPDGRTLAAGSADEKVWLWNVTNPAHPERLGQPLTGAANTVDSVAFSSNGRTLAAGSFDGKVRLWNVTDPAHPARIGRPFTGPNAPIYSVAFSPDGRSLAAGSGDDQVWLWNVTNPAHAARIGLPLTGPAGWVDSVTFSPDGRTLAAGSLDDKVWLWNVTNPAHPERLGQPLTGSANTVDSVAFSPNGRTLTAGSADHKVWLWNVSNPAHTARVGLPLTGPDNAVEAVAFSPDGQTLTAGAVDGMIWSWDLDLSKVINRICTITSSNLNSAQWARYILLPYDPPCRHI